MKELPTLIEKLDKKQTVGLFRNFEYCYSKFSYETFSFAAVDAGPLVTYFP